MVTITLYARQQKRHRCIGKSFGPCGEGERGMIWENGIQTCIISYKKWIASLGSMQGAGCLGLVRWDNLEGWCGGGSWERGLGLGICVHPWWIHVDVWQNQHNIVISLPLNKFIFKNKVIGYIKNYPVYNNISIFLHIYSTHHLQNSLEIYLNLYSGYNLVEQSMCAQ